MDVTTLQYSSSSEARLGQLSGLMRTIFSVSSPRGSQIKSANITESFPPKPISSIA